MKSALTALVALCFAMEAQAYLDPGTGSMILQVILGGVAAIGVALKLYWHRFTALFQRGSDSSTSDAGD